MKLSKVINIELALDRRGKAPLREMYREVLPWFRWIENLETYEVYPDRSHPKLIEFVLKDMNIMHHMGMVKRVIQEKAGNYYFPKEFLKALSKLDRGIPFDYLPEQFWGYFEFADNAIGDDANIDNHIYAVIVNMALDV